MASYPADLQPLNCKAKNYKILSSNKGSILNHVEGTLGLCMQYSQGSVKVCCDL